jgi:hypothetical protein
MNPGTDTTYTANAANATPMAPSAPSVPAATTAAEAAEAAETTDARREDKDDKRKKRRRVLIIILIALVVVILLHELGVLTFPWEHEPRIIVAGDLFPDVGETDDGHLENMSQEDILAQMQKIADASYFSFKINARPVFPDGSAEGNLEIENPNYNVYPMVVQIFLDDTNELIYDSGGILPDRHITKAKLLRDLPAGVHKATAYMNAYDPETKEWQGKQAAALEIEVKE